MEELTGFSFTKHPCNKKRDEAIRMSLFIILKVKKNPSFKGVFNEIRFNNL
tara:strand:- start:1639 stop:1791 length:153 start_codon:yes stop_codon:yes gene_type:complete